jgi:histidinol phosphatase-like enzyme
VLGKPSPEYFASACEALDADPELTWMVGDDVEGAGVRPDAIVNSIANLPEWLEKL